MWSAVPSARKFVEFSHSLGPKRTFLEPWWYVTIRDFVIAAYDDGVSVSTKQVLGP